MVKKLTQSFLRPKMKSVNQPPGTVTYVGRKPSGETKLEVIDYNKNNFEKLTSSTTEDAFKFEAEDRITWFNIDGLSNTAEIEKLGKYYDLHPLIIEDIVNTTQRPKIDEYEDYLFIVAKMLYHQDGKLVNEHISFVLGKDYVLTFQEAGGDVFDGVRGRLEKSYGRIRSNGSDYLVFALLDAIVDHYFLVVDELSEKVEALEEQLFESQPSDDITFEIQDLKRSILRVRRAVFPLKEVIFRFQKLENDLIKNRTRNYINDLHDHILQVSENIDLYREMAWGLMDMYMTTLSNKMNEVMKVLTIMASIFIPLTFIAGIYGMNFEYMPELAFTYAYPIFWGVVIFLGGGLLVYFKRNKWL